MKQPKKAKITDLTPDPNNINQGSQFGGQLLERSLQEVGAGRSILIDKAGKVIAGNQTLQKYAEGGGEDILIVPSDGKTLIAVQRTDVDLDSAQGAKMKILDNTVSRWNYVEDSEVATRTVEQFDLDADALGLQKKWEPTEDEETDEHTDTQAITFKVACDSLSELMEIQALLETKAASMTGRAFIEKLENVGFEAPETEEEGDAFDYDPI